MIFGKGNDERAGGGGKRVAAQMAQDEWSRYNTTVQNATKAHYRFHDYPHKLMKMREFLGL